MEKYLAIRKNSRALSLVFAIVILSGCGESRPSKTCTSEVFKNSRYNAEDSIKFFRITTAETVEKSKTCYNKFFLVTNQDTIVSYWGISNDTIKIIRNDGTKFENPYTVPFLPIKANKGDAYQYTDSKQITEQMLLYGNPVQVYILDKKFIDNDTIYTVKHIAVPKMIVDSSTPSEENLWPYEERIFKVSMKKGIIGYSIKQEKGVEEIETYW